MLVRHTMTKDPLTVGPDESCLSVLRTMRARRFRHAPVVEDGRLLGLVSERHLLSALPHLVESFAGEKGRLALEATVRSVMTHDALSCSPSDPVDTIGRQLLDARIGCMTVVSDGKLVGIVTTSDLLRGFTDHLEEQDAVAMTLLCTGARKGGSPDVGTLLSAAGLRLCAYFETETVTDARAIMVRAKGTEAQLDQFRESCIHAGLLLMTSSRAA